MNPFTDLPDVASESCGAAVLEASDDFFAPKENLIRAEPPIFIPGKYTANGKWMDGWESRRKRTPGHDWCILRVGFPAALHAVDIDTSHFLGNFPSHCSLEARLADQPWSLQLNKVRLQGNAHNLFELSGAGPFDHLRLNIFPDGGVARLRVYGIGSPDQPSLQNADFACASNGGLVIAASDMFFGSKNNLILPGRPPNMGGGWETRRRRGPGYDWIIVQLGAPGVIDCVRVETEHYKGNYPAACSVDACETDQPLAEDLATGRVAWQQIVPRNQLTADGVHEFPVTHASPVSHVRLNIYPDGGISRLRVFASPPKS